MPKETTWLRTRLTFVLAAGRPRLSPYITLVRTSTMLCSDVREKAITKMPVVPDMYRKWMPEVIKSKSVGTIVDAAYQVVLYRLIR